MREPAAATPVRQVPRPARTLARDDLYGRRFGLSVDAFGSVAAVAWLEQAGTAAGTLETGSNVTNFGTFANSGVDLARNWGSMSRRSGR